MPKYINRTKDVVEVVRCKDCKRRPYEVRKNIFSGEPVIECSPDDDGRCPCLSGDDYYSYIPEDDFFCAYGERRDNNANLE